MPRVFLFDIDGTLLNSSPAGKAAMEETLLLEFGQSPIQYNIPTAGRTDRAIVSDLLTSHQLEVSDEVFEKFRQRYCASLPRHLNQQTEGVLPGVEKLLDLLSAKLSESSIKRLGLLTGNFEQTGWAKVKHFRLDHHFSFGAFGDHHHHRDDVAREAANILKQKGVSEKETVWIIGDTPADVQCARAIGANALAVASGVYSREELEASQPDVVVDDFLNTKKILEILLS